MAGETEAGSVEVQPARDSPLKATNSRGDGGAATSTIPFYRLKPIQSFPMPKKTSSCRRQQGILLTVK